MRSLFNLFISALFTIVLTSCAVHGGVGVGYERSAFNYSNDLRAAESTEAAQADFESTNNETGFYIGLGFDDIDISENLEFQPEFNYISIKNLEQFQVPLLLSYDIVDKLSVEAGPNLGFLLDPPGGLNSFNFGADAGLSYEITDDFEIEGRYNFGLSNLLEDGSSDSSVKVSVLSFGLRYEFDLRKKSDDD